MIIIITFPKGTLIKKGLSHTHISAIAFAAWFENTSILNLNFKYWMIANEIQFSHLYDVRNTKTNTNRINWMLRVPPFEFEYEMQFVFCIQILHINCGRVKSRFSLNLLSIKRVFVQVIMYMYIMLFICGWYQFTAADICSAMFTYFVYDRAKSNRIRNK